MIREENSIIYYILFKLTYILCQGDQNSFTKPIYLTWMLIQHSEKLAQLETNGNLQRWLKPFLAARTINQRLLLGVDKSVEWSSARLSNRNCLVPTLC